MGGQRMKKIITAWSSFQKLEPLEKSINERLAEGWQIVKREVIPCPADPCKSVLFYELEQDVITEDEKTCENCRYYICLGDQEPCASCKEGEKWEAEE
jgi:hypothetical protein